MSQFNSEEIDSLSADEATQEEKFVPVSESIRYRRRAQGAEKKAAMLEDELAKASSEKGRLSEELSQLKTEQKLVKELILAGVSDLEAAVLIAKARLQAQDEVDVSSVVHQLKKEKQYLFGKAAEVSAAAGKTAGAKQKNQSGPSSLERAAGKAAATGSRLDLQNYLKLRRNYA